MKKIKCIVKRPDEKYGHMTSVSDNLKNLQKIVGGYIEVVPVSTDKTKIVCICDEEDKLKGYDRNFKLYGDVIVGTVIICGVEEDEFADIPIDFQTWKKVYDKLQEFEFFVELYST